MSIKKTYFSSLFLFLFLFLFLNIELVAQFTTAPNDFSWQALYGGNRSEQINNLVESFEGGLIAVGTTKSSTQGKTDAYLLLLDKTMNLLHEKNFGGIEEDVAYAVAKTLDGTYWMVGYTESSLPNYQGNRDAWVVKLDEKGIIIGQQCFGTVGKDEFKDIVATEDGGALLVGHQEEHLWMLKLAANGQIEWQNTYRYQGQASFANTCILDKENDIVIAGYTLSDEESNMLIIKLNERGELIWEKIFPTTEARVANDLVLTTSGNYAVTGIATLPLQKDDAFFMSLNSEGKVLISQLFGGRGLDGAYAITQSTNGDLFLTGYTMSMIRKARTPRLWLQVMTEYGKPLWESYYGSKLEDKAYDIIQKSDGELVLGGMHKSDEAWLLAFEPDTFPPLAPPTKLEIQAFAFSYPDNTGVLEPQKRGYLSFLVTNLGTSDAYELEAKVACSSCFKGVNFFENIQLGALKSQQSKIYSIPVYTEEQVGNGINQFEIAISEANQAIISPSSFSFKVRTKQAAKAQLAFLNSSFFSTKKENVTKGDTLTFKVEIKNIGEKTAQQIAFRFEHNEALQQVGKQNYRLNYLKPNGTKYLQYDMVLQQELTDSLILNLEIASKDIPAIYQNFELTLDHISAQEKEQTIQALTWLVPDASETEPIVWEEKKFSIEIEVNSKIILEKENFKLLVNGKACRGCKFDEASLSGDTIYRYKNQVILEEGLNDIKLEVTYNDSKKETELMQVNYVPKKPNLYVLSIGVPLADLEYSVKDAEDFANVFRNQTITDGLYHEVIIDTLLSAERTNRSTILATLEKFRHHPIQPKDVVLIFISSHGTQKSRTVRLHCSDYNSNDLFNTTIEYEQDLLMNLEKVGGRKLMFLDACHSGFLGQKNKPISSDIQKILAEKSQLKTMASCQANEYSYEDARWKNGAFTEALLEAFSNTEGTNKNASFWADTNDDKELSLSEVFQFVKKRVPHLVETKGDTPSSQNPLVSSTEGNFVFYKIGDKKLVKD